MLGASGCHRLREVKEIISHMWGRAFTLIDGGLYHFDTQRDLECETSVQRLTLGYAFSRAVFPSNSHDDVHVGESHVP